MKKTGYTGKYLKKYVVTTNIHQVMVRELVSGECLVNDIHPSIGVMGPDEVIIDLVDSLADALETQRRIVNVHSNV